MDQALIDKLTAPLRSRKPVSSAVRVDPLTLSTVWHGLQRICREMRRVIERTSQSYLISQLKDISVGIWDGDGRTVAIPVGLATQFVGGKFSVRFILDEYRNKVNPGDVFLATTSRTLTKLELESEGDLTGQSLHWAIYSSASKAGPYAPEFDVITPGGPAGFQSSGTISASLTAGRYYLVAIQLASSGYYYLYRSTALTPTMSFGQPVGWLSTYGSAGMLPLSVSNVSPVAGAFHFRFTTKP